MSDLARIVLTLGLVGFVFVFCCLCAAAVEEALSEVTQDIVKASLFIGLISFVLFIVSLWV